jgi:hypothetical protein
MNKNIKIIAAFALIPFSLAMGADEAEPKTQSVKRGRSATIVEDIRIEQESQIQSFNVDNADIIVLPKRTTPHVDIFSRIPMDPFYFRYCPAQNAQSFASWLVTKKVDTKNLTPENAAKKYKSYLRHLIRKKGRNGINPDIYSVEEINSILPIFNDMYEGIIKPFIDGAAEGVAPPLKRLCSR